MPKEELKGKALLHNPILNKGTAFTAEERSRYGLYGFLPPHIENIEEQVERCRGALALKTLPIEKHIYLRALQDINETLFYRFILDDIEELLPLIYTPVVGEACQHFHLIYRQARGLFISYPERDHMDEIFAAIAQNRTIKVIVVTDGERILGLGDQGAGGLGIPIGKLSLYTACGGIPPEYTLPIVLDVGTNNEARLSDPEYLGWRHSRISGSEYYDFVDQFVQTVKKYFPDILLQFEDFAQAHAYPLLNKYRDQLCSFNDDIQGTASVAVAALLAAIRLSEIPLNEHRIAVLGAGSAGCGISEQLCQAIIRETGESVTQVRSRFFLIDKNGLLQADCPDILPFQQDFVKTADTLSHWGGQRNYTLSDVINNAKPTILLGVSGQPNQFTEPMIKQMASYCPRPIIFPLSNPTSKAEALPADLLNWTRGQALVATGSPFASVVIDHKHIDIAQCNNVYIFPGMGLAVVAGKIKRITDGMMLEAAMALSKLAPAIKTGHGRLLPDIKDIRQVSQVIAQAVILKAVEEGYAAPLENIDMNIKDSMWEPRY